MDEILEFLLRYRYLVLVVFVFAEQVGLPLPALPVLLASGALARTGEIHLSLAIALCVVAAVASDLLWYEIGRRRGLKVLNLLCRIALEPDSCVRNTQELFSRHGARSLLVAKFVPGYNTAAPPLAGIFGMRLGRFLVYDALGALLWIATFTGLGYAFGYQLEALTERLVGLGSGLGAVILGGLVVYLLVKIFQRQLFLRELRIARITPQELRDKLASDQEIVVVDLRHSVEFEADPDPIPGALKLSLEEVDQRSDEIPRDREIILFCT